MLHPFQTRSLLSIFTVLFGVHLSCQAAVIFTEDFEDPDVTAADSDGNTSGAVPTGWVLTTEGFGAKSRGVVDEGHGDFTDPSDQQAFAFRYTNSGLTTEEGLIGNLTAGFTYTITFDVVMDEHNDTTAYRVYLAAFDLGATSRNDIRSDTNQRTALGITHTGNATTDGLYTTTSFSYTSDGTEGALLGRDVGLVFFGATSSAIIDNVIIDVTPIPEPSSILLLSLASLGLAARRHRG